MSDTIKTQELCAMTGWSEEHLRTLAEKGWMPAPRRGVWERDRTLKGLFSYARKKIALKSSTLAEQKLRTERLRGDMLAEKVKEASDKFVELSATEEAWESLVLSFRECLLSLPSRLTPLLLAQRTPVEIEALLVREIREALEELAKPVGDVDVDAATS